MPETPDETADLFVVVVNHLNQYSTWPLSRTVPAGWTPVTEGRSQQACLSYIGEVWTDIRPRPS